MKRFICSVVLMVFVLVFMSVIGPYRIEHSFASEDGNQLGVNQTVLSGQGAPGQLIPSGEYAVFVYESGEWREAGRLACDKYLHEKEIDLNGYSLSPDGLKVRLVKMGGGAGHIDSVFLDGEPPVKVNGSGAFELNKLSQKDYDVINVDESGMELEFAAGAGGTLAVTARIENLVINKIPFQFPTANNYRTMTEDSSFYNYRLNSVEGAVTVDGNISEVSENEPFLEEYCLPGSGHPPGFIYGWVMNDNQNLYVIIDFIPDNTMDGEKDYAKVYVNTDAGLKEFKVSVSETSWGRAAFVYTDRAAYQHKVYEFAIPLTELGVNSADSDVELSLAFAAYGTATPEIEINNPQVACDPDNNKYMVVYEKWEDGESDIYGNFIYPDDSVSVPIVINDDGGDQVRPSVAFDTYNEKYLVVWQDDNDCEIGGIYGQIIDNDGTPVGSSIQISDSDDGGFAPSVAYDVYNNKLLVVWDYYDSILGQFVDLASGQIEGDGVFPISSSQSNKYNPKLAYDSMTRKFLVVWEDYGEYRSIYGRLVDYPGDSSNWSDEFKINNSTASEQFYPSVAGGVYDSDAAFLVTWVDIYYDCYEDCYYSIKGRIVNGGVPQGSELTILDEWPFDWCQFNVASAAADSVNKEFLAVYKIDDGNSVVTYYRAINAEGVFLGEAQQITDDQYLANPAVVFNSSEQSFLVVYQLSPEGDLAFEHIITDTQAVAADKNALTFNTIKASNTAQDNITTNLSLPGTGEHGTIITWSSGNTAFISDTGVVTRPAGTQGDQAVTLTATISKGAASDTKTFGLTVKAITGGSPKPQVIYKYPHLDKMKYKVHLPAGSVRDSAGNGLAQDYDFNFYTGSQD